MGCKSVDGGDLSKININFHAVLFVRNDGYVFVVHNKNAGFQIMSSGLKRTIRTIQIVASAKFKSQRL